MISALFLAIGGLILAMIHGVLSQLQFQFPNFIINGIEVFIDVMHATAPFLPFIGDIVLMAIIVIPAHVIRYVFTLLLWIFSLIPVIGRVVPYPKHFTESYARSWMDDKGNPHVKHGHSSTTKMWGWGE